MKQPVKNRAMKERTSGERNEETNRSKKESKINKK